MKYKLCTIIALLACSAAQANDLSEKYNEQHPLVIVGDWDKPPYEFINDKGEPAGTNIDLMRALCEQLGIHCRFILKEWSGALKTFEREDAHIILANAKRYRSKKYVCSQNIINYNRICAATRTADSTANISITTLLAKGVVVKPSDYTDHYFRNMDSMAINHVEYQSPKVALQGVLSGDYKYFCWGEEPLKWKIDHLHLSGIAICEVDIPVSEVHIVGRDQDLIYRLDDIYSRLKQSGEVQRINDRWMHPERLQEQRMPLMLIYVILGALITAATLYFFARLAKKHVKNTTRSSTELKDIMFKALKMGNFHIMEYDIKHDLMTNRYGTPILPEQGITLDEFTKHIHPREQEEFKQKMQALLSGRKRKFELKKRWSAYPEPGVAQKTEQWLYLDGHAMVETDKNGQPTTIFKAIHDVTHDEKAEQQIHDIECKYNTLFNITSLAISFYDKEGKLLELNDCMKEICDITPGNPDAQRFWSTVRLFDIPLFRSVYKAGTKEPIQACMYMKYDELGLNRCVEYHVQPLLDSNDEVACYYVTTIDLTDERQIYMNWMKLNTEKTETTNKIRQQKDWLIYLLKHSDRYIMHSSIAKRNISFYRQPEHPEYEQQLDDFCNNSLVEADSRPFHELLTDTQTKKTQQFVIHMKNKTEDSLPGPVFQETFHPVIDNSGHITGHEGISADISKLIHARQQLKELTEKANDSVRLKSEFMASITHELRTPLNAIIGFTSVINTLNDTDERAEYVRIIQNSSDMMQRLLNDITQASSINDGHSSLQYSEVNFPTVFDQICLTLQQRVQEPVQFVKENNYDKLTVNIDVERVQQVITNFVTNAVKFTTKGHIRLGYRYEQGTLHIFCEDTGLGIPKDKQDDIFQRFVKLDEFVQGTGMGLAISKTIVEHMGGTIGVASKGIGHGSTFWFQIPA